MFSLSPTTQHILIVAIIIMGSFLLSKFLKYLLKKYIDAQVNLLESEKTNYNFFKHTISFVIFLGATIGIFYTIPFPYRTIVYKNKDVSKWKFLLKN